MIDASEEDLLLGVPSIPSNLKPKNKLLIEIHVCPRAHVFRSVE